MGMSFIGSYSGIDQNTIDKLMQAERMPLKQLENKKTSIGEKQSAWKDVNTRLNNLYEKMNALKNADSFNTKLAKSSDDKFVSMTAGTKATEGKYTIKVEILATNSAVIGKQVKVEGKLVDPEIALGKTGKFSIKNGDDTEVNIEILAGDSLKSVVDKINSVTKDFDKLDADGEVVLEDGKPVKVAGTGVTATIVDGRIVLNNEKTGDRDIVLKDDETPGNEILSDIGLDVMGENTESGPGADTSWGVQKGTNAKFTLNNIVIERDTNTISDAIEGVTINLNKVHTGEQSDTVTVSVDTDKAAKLIQDFVDQYNSTMSFIEEKTAAGDPKAPGSKGVLAGESSLIRLQSSLRRAVTDVIGADKDSINVVSKLGVTTTDKSGKLSFDKSKFLEALKDDKDGVMNFLNPKEGTGLIEKVNKEIDMFISKENGFIKSQNESFEKTLKDLSTRIENFEERMVRKEAYYVKTFTALDLAMMKAESQMQWLQGQVDSMNGVKR